MGKKYYYAVQKGRGGPTVYETWEECKANVSRYPGAVFKKFTSRVAAEEWILPALNSSNVPPEDSIQPVMQPIYTEAEPSNIVSASSDATTESENTTVPRIALSEEQKQILQQVKQGQNVFFTGSAGTGKSVLLRTIIEFFEATPGRKIAITASTGIASVNINGTTLHSWAGIGLGEEKAERLAGKILGTEWLRKRWWDVQCLIIDEISMIDGVLFDKLEDIARRVRDPDMPFGGIQLVLSGDFCQLPPVPDRRERNIPSTFAFDAKSWSQCIGSPVTLTHVFRQRDQGFVNMLNAMRWGRLNNDMVSRFRQLAREVTYTDGIEPTELYPTRNEVETSNNSRLDQINSEAVPYLAWDRPGVSASGRPTSDREMERLLERLIALKMVVLKVGAQVMLVKNLKQGQLVNGSLGKVIRFSTYKDAARRHTQTLPNGANENEISTFVRQSPMFWPVVKFTNGVERLCVPEEFTVNNASGEVEASRHQVPLILAWALSIHKSQGQTLERVKVDLRNIFEKGQAYVALSRATSMETLEVRNFDPQKVVAHPRVIEWYNSIAGAGSKQENTGFDEQEEYEQYLLDEANGYFD